MPGVAGPHQIHVHRDALRDAPPAQKLHPLKWAAQYLIKNRASSSPSDSRLQHAVVTSVAVLMNTTSCDTEVCGCLRHHQHHHDAHHGGDGIKPGTQPIIGYNYGARHKRVRETFYYSAKVATIITSTGSLSGNFPRTLTSAFTTDQELISITERGIRFAVAALPLVGIQIVASSFFQSLGYAAKSMIQSLSRQLIFLVPGLLIFPRVWGLDGVWLAIPVADTLAALLSVYLLTTQIRLLKRLEAKDMHPPNDDDLQGN